MAAFWMRNSTRSLGELWLWRAEKPLVGEKRTLGCHSILTNSWDQQQTEKECQKWVRVVWVELRLSLRAFTTSSCTAASSQTMSSRCSSSVSLHHPPPSSTACQSLSQTLFSLCLIGCLISYNARHKLLLFLCIQFPIMWNW